MPFFVWTPQLDTGIAQVDEQHKTLVDALNRLHDAMKQGKGRDEVGKSLLFLQTYTASHFKAEEAFMVLHAYPEAARHKAIHEDLIRQVNELVEKHQKGTMTLSMAVMDFLQDWLTKHIAGEDQRYAAYFREKGIQV